MVTLEKESDGTKKEFEFSYAEITLRRKKAVYKGKPFWKLPEDSEYAFKNGSLTKKAKKKEQV